MGASDAPRKEEKLEKTKNIEKRVKSKKTKKKTTKRLTKQLQLDPKHISGLYAFRPFFQFSASFQSYPTTITTATTTLCLRAPPGVVAALFRAIQRKKSSN